MKKSRKIWGVVLSLMLLLSACSNSSQSAHSQSDNFQMDSYQTSNSQSDSSSENIESKTGSAEERSENFIENFSLDYPTFELLDYVLGSDKNIPIQLVAIAKNKETGSSSTLFILDSNGVGQVVLASEYSATYRKEDGLQLDNNAILISLDLKISDTNSEIHDFNITVTQTKDNQGKINTVYSSQETTRSGN